jgi:hypothetical protein
LVEDYFDQFERVYDDRFADKHGFWRTVIRKIAYLNVPVSSRQGFNSDRDRVSFMRAGIAAACGNTFASIVVSSDS